LQGFALTLGRNLLTGWKVERDRQWMLRLGSVVMGAADVARAVAFWCAALGYDAVPFDDAEDDFTILVPPNRVGTRVGIHRSITPADDRPRTHLDLIVDTPEEQVAEVARLVGLGAEQVAWDYPTDPDFVVLADTEGNRFCIVDVSHG
jgi:catechol 2,3-dioxygenase-like lactoylglutathione lyase family enzyme